MGKRRKPGLVGLPSNKSNDDGKFKRKEVFVPVAGDNVWRVVHETCVDCGERFIQIHGDAVSLNKLFFDLASVIGERLSDFAGNGAIKFCLELNALNAQTRPH